MDVEDRYFWKTLAVCRGGDMDALFVNAVEQREARKICYHCPVRLHCLIEAFQSSSEYGIWGGLTERERSSIRRAHPEVKEWEDWVRHSPSPLAQEARANRIPRIHSIIREQRGLAKAQVKKAA